MEYEVFNIIRGSFFLEIAIATYIFMIPLRKKTNYKEKYILLCAIGIVFAMFVPGSFYKFILETAIVCMIVYICCDVKILKAVQSVLCAYAVQHFAYVLEQIVLCVKFMFLHINTPVNADRPKISYIFILSYTFSCLILYFGLIRRKGRDKGNDVSVEQAIPFSIVAFVIVMVLSYFMPDYQMRGNEGLFIICYIQSAIACLFIIAVDDAMYHILSIGKELDVIHYLWKRRQYQYSIAKENINQINTNCHELKKQIESMQKNELSNEMTTLLKQLSESVQIYDAVVKTGNEVLDVVLTEKSLYCQANQITIAFVVDGKEMEFIAESDIYFLFSNILDDAIEYAEKIQDPAKRQIALSVWKQKGLFMIQSENYFIQSHNNDNSFTVKSVKYIVEKYKGCLTVHQEHDLLIKRVSIPMV